MPSTASQPTQSLFRWVHPSQFAQHTQIIFIPSVNNFSNYKQILLSKVSNCSKLFKTLSGFISHLNLNTIAFTFTYKSYLKFIILCQVSWKYSYISKVTFFSYSDLQNITKNGIGSQFLPSKLYKTLFVSCETAANEITKS